MFWPLATILVALAVFNVVVLRRHRRVGASTGAIGMDLEQLRGFAYVGAGALALLAVAVVALGLRNPGNGYAEATAVLGLIAYALYLAVAGALGLVQRRGAAPRRRSAPKVAMNGEPGGDRTGGGAERPGPEQT